MFGCTGSSLLRQSLPVALAGRGCSLAAVCGSRCAGFSRCRAGPLGHVGFGAGAHGLSSRGSVAVAHAKLPGGRWDLPDQGLNQGPLHCKVVT